MACVFRIGDVGRRDGVVPFRHPGVGLPEVAPNAHWHAVHGERRSANEKKGKLTAGEMQVRVHPSARRRC